MTHANAGQMTIAERNEWIARVRGRRAAQRTAEALPTEAEKVLDELERDQRKGRVVRLDVRCCPEEKLRWASAAAALDVSISEFVRTAAGRASDDVLTSGPV